MKEQELAKCKTCAICNRNIITQVGAPMFYRVSIERFVINAVAIQRQAGLAMHLGSGILANVMGPNEDMAIPFCEKTVVTVCGDCCIAQTRIAHLDEIGEEVKS